MIDRLFPSFLWEKEVAFYPLAPTERRLHCCAFDPITKSLVAIPKEQSPSGLQTSLEVIADQINLLLMAPPIKIFSLSPIRFQTFLSNVQQLSDLIDNDDLRHMQDTWKARRNWFEAAMAMGAIRSRILKTASAAIQRTSLQFCNPESYVRTMAQREIPIRTINSLKYNTVKSIGGGGEGEVFKIMDRKTCRYQAVKYSLSSRDHQQWVVASIMDIFERGLSLHLTRVYETFMIPRGPVLKICRNWFPENLCKAWLMEMLDGDFEQISRKKEFFSGAQADTYIIQIAFIQILLWNHYGIQVIDADGFCYRNIFYKHVTSEDTFRGNRLIDYDYWKYAICEEVFYVPRPKLLLKLGDYDQWTCDLTYATRKPDRECYTLDILKCFLFDEATSLTKLRQKYAHHPGPQARVLDMGKV